MLWEVEIHPASHVPDREAARVLEDARALGAVSIRDVRSARSFLIQGDVDATALERIAAGFLVDTVVETHTVREMSTQYSVLSTQYGAREVETAGRDEVTGQRSEIGGQTSEQAPGAAGLPLRLRPPSLVNVLFKPGVTDNVADSVRQALVEL